MAKMPAANAATVADAKTWVKAEKQYADPAIRVSDIAKLVGLSAIQLSNEAKKRGWPLRTTAGKSSAAPKSKTATTKTTQSNSSTPATETSKASTPKPIVLVRRVYKAIDGELSKLEKQKGASSQDRERASRALSQMVNSLEKAIEMQREMTKDTAKGSNAQNKEALTHAEDLRRAIAERVERLQRQRTPAKRSGAAD